MNRGKKWITRILLMLTVMMLAMPLSASAAQVKLNKKKVTLKTGNTYTLKLLNTTDEVTWTSTKPAVVTVDSTGKITAVKRGTAYVVAQAGAKKYKCKVTVKQPVTSIKLNQKNILISKGKTYQLKYKVYPTNANVKTLKWSSSNKKVVTVSKGKIKAVGAGTATITATAKDGSGVKATCKIKVKAPMTISKKTLSLTEGSSATLTVTNTEGKSLAWASSDSSIASVSNGKVTAKKAGKAVIVAKQVDGTQSVSCTVTVTAKTTTTTTTNGSISAKRLLAILQKYSDQVKADKAAGIKWGYSNSGKLIRNTWQIAYDETRSGGIAYVNCALTPVWALREMGVIGSKNFYGQLGGTIKYCGGAAAQANTKAMLEKYCDIIPVYKTPNQLLAEGNLLPGDICTWVEYQHTNVYAGNGKWYDSGRNGSIGGYQNGTFIFNSFGPAATVSMSGSTVGYIIRIK